MEALTPTEQALLDYLRRDAAASGQASSFVPSWLATALEMDRDEFVAAARRLADLGLVRVVPIPPGLRGYVNALYPLTIMDIRLTEVR